MGDVMFSNCELKLFQVNFCIGTFAQNGAGSVPIVITMSCIVSYFEEAV